MKIREIVQTALITATIIILGMIPYRYHLVSFRFQL